MPCPPPFSPSCSLVLSQVPSHRLPLVETDGLRQLLSALKDAQLPWSVRQHACAALHNACTSATACAEFVSQKGLEVVLGMLDAYVSGKPLVMVFGAGSAAAAAAATVPQAPALAAAAAVQGVVVPGARARTPAPAGQAAGGAAAAAGWPRGRCAGEGAGCVRVCVYRSIVGERAGGNGMFCWQAHG